MKKMFIIAVGSFLIACNQPGNDVKKMQAEIDSLRQELKQSYKPGFGEFMSGIQMHHAKLWFAGHYRNWDLADFEVHEIEELLENIQQYNSLRPEVKAIGMIDTPMHNLIHSIEQKNAAAFDSNFVLLTNTCNDCHKATSHAYNVVTIPSSPPVVNQDFSPLP